MAQRGCTSVARNLAALNNETALAYVSGVVAALAVLAGGAVRAMGLLVKRQRATKAMLNRRSCHRAMRWHGFRLSCPASGWSSKLFMRLDCYVTRGAAPHELLNTCHFLVAKASSCQEVWTAACTRASPSALVGGLFRVMPEAENDSAFLSSLRRSFTGSHENHGAWRQSGDAISNASNQVPIQARQATS
jgi:hypothetical protein